ncbi:MAG: pyridoxal-phosphate dependent enzyme [Enterocloster sp.]
MYASTGNNGASGAAFAAKAGMPCVILTVKGVNKTLETFMQVYGAKLIGVKTVSERWEVLKYLVNQCGWYPATNYVVPIVGKQSMGYRGL